MDAPVHMETGSNISNRIVWEEEWKKKKCTKAAAAGSDHRCSSNLDRQELKEPHQPGSCLPQEGLQVSASHQLQQDEPGHGLQADSHATHDVLVAEFAGRDETRTTFVKAEFSRDGFRVCFFVFGSIKVKQLCFLPDDQRLHEEVQLILLGANLGKSLLK